MIKVNFLITALAALVPLITGFVWYSPKIGFGKAWLKSTGLTEDELKKANMALIFGLTFLFSFMLAFVMNSIVRHEFGFFSMLANEPGMMDNDANAEAMKFFISTTARYGHEFHTFKHGALHGTIAALFIGLPVIGIVSLFERKNFKYIALHVGYWAVTMALMGGIIAGFS